MPVLQAEKKLMRYTRSSRFFLHPISIPGQLGSGDIGASSYHIINWLSKSGQSFLQMLPLNLVGLANSPHVSLSASVGNPLLIELNDLIQNGWLLQNDLDNTPYKSSNRLNHKEVVPF